MTQLVECPHCHTDVHMRHLHDEAYGISGTHMAGSERFECPACGTPLSHVEAQQLGLKFLLDTGADPWGEDPT